MEAIIPLGVRYGKGLHQYVFVFVFAGSDERKAKRKQRIIFGCQEIVSLLLE